MVKVMMAQNDISFNEDRLQAVGLPEVYTRLCGNLINIYSHSRNTSKQRVLLDVLLAISPNNIEYSIRHAQVWYGVARRSFVHLAAMTHASVKYSSKQRILSKLLLVKSAINNRSLLRHLLSFD